MKTIVVEDSRLAREGLVRMLEAYPEIEVVEALDNIESALVAIEKLQPELLFLDIHLPEGNAFELLEELSYEPRIVFTTAYSEYAIQSFSYQTIDYLLKPISNERLQQAINKITNAVVGDTKKHRLSVSDRIMLRDKGESTIVAISDIFYIESCKNYVQVFLQDEKYFIKKPLSYVEDRLSEKTFFRASRQCLINLNKIQNMVENVSATFELTLKNGAKIDVSRRNAIKLRSLLEL